MPDYEKMGWQEIHEIYGRMLRRAVTEEDRVAADQLWDRYGEQKLRDYEGDYPEEE